MRKVYLALESSRSVETGALLLTVIFFWKSFRRLGKSSSFFFISNHRTN
jgi:hypothetical protein